MNAKFSMHDDPRLPSAWAPWFSHEYITYYSVRPIERVMGLDPVRVRPNPVPFDAGWPLGHRHVDLYKERFHETRRLDPIWSFDYKERNGDFAAIAPEDVSIEPWKVLVIYTTEPDLYPDCDLSLHRLQKLTGGSHGWRHMQFRALGMTLGMVRESYSHHVSRAIDLFGSGSEYWGWRYLSRATHYLADLGNPFHVKAAPRSVLLRNFFSFDRLLKTLSAVHHGFEVYAERRFREGYHDFAEALSAGSREGHASGLDVNAEMDAYIRRAERRMKPVFTFFMEQFGRDLVDAFAQMDRNSREDAATQTNLCSGDAARVIFREIHLPSLSYLDGITTEILFDVGRMLGMMLAGTVR